MKDITITKSPLPIKLKFFIMQAVAKVGSEQGITLNREEQATQMGNLCFLKIAKATQGHFVEVSDSRRNPYEGQKEHTSRLKHHFLHRFLRVCYL